MMKADSSPTRLRLGTRRSKLALAQSELVARALEELHEGLEVELVPISTTGDTTSGDLAELGGKGLFTQELEVGLLAGEIDLAVHSLKDLPVRLAAGLHIAAYPQRADPRDVLISETATDLEDLPPGARLLTGSLRRTALLLRCRPDLEIEAVRGNVDTRIRKWREQGADGIILAAAGLERLPGEIERPPIYPLDPEIVVPAPGQGTLAVQTATVGPTDRLCAALNHRSTERSALAERAVVAAFGGDCTLPLGAWCRAGEEVGVLTLTAFLSTPDGRFAAQATAHGKSSVELAAKVVAALRAQGADEILDRLKG